MTQMTDQSPIQSLSIPDNKSAQFVRELNEINLMCLDIGSEVSQMALEIASIYDITEENLADPVKFYIRNIFVGVLDVLAKAMDECESLKEKIEDSEDESTVIDGSEYLFIYKFLSEIPISYMTLVSLIRAQRYLNDKLMYTANKRLKSIFSVHFENIRGHFKVVESTMGMQTTTQQMTTIN